MPRAEPLLIMSAEELDDFAAGTRAIGDIADMLDGLPDEELIEPAALPPLSYDTPLAA